MNSLVVFLSVVALAVASPSGLAYSAGLVAYSSPFIAEPPAAVSSQSRLDIKSSPALVATAAIEPVVRSVVAAPTLLAASPAIAPAAISSQSRIDIKSTPAVTSTIISAPVAYNTPALAYNTAALTYNAPVAYNTPYLTSAFAPAVVKTELVAPTFLKAGAIAAPVFASPFAAPTVPLDTPEVIAARAAHFEAKALAGAHLIKKRSASLIAAPLVSTHLAAPYTYSTPLAYSSPLSYSTPLTYSPYVFRNSFAVHHW